jgi:hypothetical protein
LYSMYGLVCCVWVRLKKYGTLKIQRWCSCSLWTSLN